MRTVAPSISGRLVEAQAAARALRDALFEAAVVERERLNDGEGPHAWVVLETAAESAAAAEKSLLDVQCYATSARLRGWPA